MKYSYLFIWFFISNCTHLNGPTQTRTSFKKTNQHRKLNQINQDYAQKAFLPINYLNSTKIQNTIKKYLSNIYSESCNSKEKSQPKKWTKLILNFNNFNQYLNKHLQMEERLKDNDWYLIKHISNNVNPEVLGYKKLQKDSSNCKTLKRTFNINYINYYNLQENATINDFPDTWAKKIMKSLTCVCNG